MVTGALHHSLSTILGIETVLALVRSFATDSFLAFLFDPIHE